MSEMGELYRIMREDAAEKRRSNLAKSTDILRKSGIAFESRNDGFHLMIRTGSGVVNFYPSTGRYAGAFDGRGVFNLLRDLGVDK